MHGSHFQRLARRGSGAKCLHETSSRENRAPNAEKIGGSAGDPQTDTILRNSRARSFHRSVVANSRKAKEDSLPFSSRLFSARSSF